MSDAITLRAMADNLVKVLAPSMSPDDQRDVSQSLMAFVIGTQAYVAEAVEAVREGAPEAVMEDAITELLEGPSTPGTEDLPQMAAEALDRALAAMLDTVPSCSRCGAPADHAGEC